jgi:hypothetical protein
MKSQITLLASAVLFASLVAPASARTDGDDGGPSAYPRFRHERTQMTDFRGAADHLVNRPSYRR